MDKKMNLLQRTQQAIDYLNECEDSMRSIAPSIGISHQWLSAFKAGNYHNTDVGVKKVQAVLDYFEEEAAA